MQAKGVSISGDELHRFRIRDPEPDWNAEDCNAGAMCSCSADWVEIAGVTERVPDRNARPG